MENVIIIGGGPAGLAASLYLARANLNPLLFAGSPPGGQLMLTSDVENYPGFESILGPQLIEKYRAHVQKFGTRIIDQNITKVHLNNSPFTLSTVDKSYSAKAIIITTGAKALWLNLPNEQRLRGKGVSACATCDAFFFKDKIVAVVGGGDTAMEETLTLTKFASKVYLIHRRGQFRASKIMQERVFKNPKVEIIWNSMVVDVLGEDKVEGLKLKKVKDVILNHAKRGEGSLANASSNESRDSSSSTQNDKENILIVDGLFLAIGHKPDTDIFMRQVEFDSKGYIITSARLSLELAKFKIQSSKFKVTVENSKLEEIKNKFNLNFHSSTSVEGVFAAGDCVDYIYRQAGTAVGMGIEAALDVEKWLGVETPNY
ncbi:FAD-dependent oxidoreductase [Candidatus Roizmanbacteria bacterium]|nr:FAD-dependent oxidoreductase [Candidatus Roizmanbacteria bacterium]